MLTSYAGCWGSFTLRGLALALFGAVVLLAPHAAQDAAVMMLATVLLVSAANAVSVGLRLRPLARQWWWLLLEAGLAGTIGAIAFVRPAPAALELAAFPAVLAVSSGLLQLALAWRGRRGPHRAWPMASAGSLSLGFALLLGCLALPAGLVAAPAIGLLAASLGAGLASLGLRLRREGRLARHELLRDAPLAQRGAARRAMTARGWNAV